MGATHWQQRVFFNRSTSSEGWERVRAGPGRMWDGVHGRGRGGGGVIELSRDGHHWVLSGGPAGVLPCRPCSRSRLQATPGC